MCGVPTSIIKQHRGGGNKNRKKKTGYPPFGCTIYTYTYLLRWYNKYTRIQLVILLRISFFFSLSQTRSLDGAWKVVLHTHPKQTALNHGDLLNSRRRMRFRAPYSHYTRRLYINDNVFIFDSERDTCDFEKKISKIRKKIVRYNRGNR